MTKLEWAATGSRFYESGIDRGVLYPSGVGSLGVPWNGLVSVSERTSGGEAVPYYLDGIKYLNLSSGEEFKAQIQAFSSPQEFDLCDGTVELAPGLSGTQQPRRQFGFTYRTTLGNDVDGLDLGYQIHLVYGAMASPATRNHKSLSDTLDPMTLSWDIETVPVRFAGYKPSAHWVVDSTLTHPVVLLEIEKTLYGDIGQHPTLPLPADLIELFDAMVRGYGHGPYGHGPYGYGP